MIKRLQKRYALSQQGAKDLVKGCLACVLQNLSFMFPVGLLYFLVADLMNGGVPSEKLIFYIIGCAVCISLILLTTYIQYNATYLPPIQKAECGGLRWLNDCGKYRCLSSGKRIWLTSPALSWLTVPF